MRALLLAAGLALGFQTGNPDPASRHTTEDQDALAGFAFYLGTWRIAELPERSLVIEEGVGEHSIRFQGFLEREAERNLTSDARIGWHYGDRELVFHEFIREPGVFEGLRVGTCSFQPGEHGPTLLRRYQTFEPDGTRRDRRERYTPLDAQRWRLDVEGMTESGRWKRQGAFVGLRQAASTRESAAHRR